MVEEVHRRIRQPLHKRFVSKFFQENVCLSKVYYEGSDQPLFKEFVCLVFRARDMKVCFYYRFKRKKITLFLTTVLN